MARMYPEDVERFHTDGERSVYRFLSEAARPDDAHTVWYTPDVADREPDFLLYSDAVGLVVLEVKDWVLGQIRKADAHSFEIQKGGRVERLDNPLRQARDYGYEVLERLRKDGRLVSREPPHEGKPRVPVSHGVVFANINSQEFREADLGKVIPFEKAFFWDDLHPASPLRADPSGRAFRESLAARFPPRFPVALTGKDKYVLKELLFPEVRVAVPDRGAGPDEYGHRRERLRVLDHHQEAFARKWDGGHRLLVGPSGSGKTLVLVHKAAFLRRYDPAIRRVLLVCYNVTLVNYLRRLLAAKGVPLGEKGVEVLHFFELCAEVLGEPVRYEGEEPEVYELIVAETLARVAAGGPRYDAVLVDEGQDFSDDMFRVVTGLLNPATDNLTIALDAAQDLYRPKAGWRELGVKARGRVHRLAAVYRNSREIVALAECFAGRDEEAGDGGQKPRQLELLPDEFTSHGPAPEIRRHESLGAVMASLSGTVQALQQEHGYPLSEFVVLYPRRSPTGAPEVNLPRMAQEALDGAGILWRWASEDYRSKRAYDITADSVTISTVHSVKGLDYACAILVGFDLLQPGRWTEAQIQSLVYVALTRARHHLVIPYAQTNAVVERLLACRT